MMPIINTAMKIFSGESGISLAIFPNNFVDFAWPNAIDFAVWLSGAFGDCAFQSLMRHGERIGAPFIRFDNVAVHGESLPDFEGLSRILCQPKQFLFFFRELVKGICHGNFSRHCKRFNDDVFATEQRPRAALVVFDNHHPFD